MLPIFDDTMGEDGDVRFPCICDKGNTVTFQTAREQCVRRERAAPSVFSTSESLEDMIDGVGVKDETRIEEARERRPARRPTTEEIRRRQATHFPSRDWCSRVHCRIGQ